MLQTLQDKETFSFAVSWIVPGNLCIATSATCIFLLQLTLSGDYKLLLIWMIKPLAMEKSMKNCLSSGE